MFLLIYYFYSIGLEIHEFPAVHIEEFQQNTKKLKYCKYNAYSITIICLLNCKLSIL